MSFSDRLPPCLHDPDLPQVDAVSLTEPLVEAAGDCAAFPLELSISSELLRALFEKSADAVLLIEDGVFSNCNRAALNLLGIRSSGELGAQRLWNFAPPLQADGTPSEAKAKALFAEALRTGSVRADWLFRRPDGSTIPLEVVLTEIRVSGRSVLHSVWRDMTQRHQTERDLAHYRDQLQLLVDDRTAELELARQRVEAILNNSVDGIVLADTITGIVQTNFAFDALFGCAPDDYFGLPLSALVHPADAPQLAQLISDVVTERTGKRLEVRALRQDGQVVDTEFGIGFIGASATSGNRLVCSIRDITERKNAEKALHVSEERYRSVVDHIKEVIFQTDRQGIFTFLNPAWSEVTGFSVAETLGKLSTDYIHPNDRERNAQLIGPMIRRETSYCRHEVLCLTKDGSSRWLEIFARLTLDEHDLITGTSGTLMDITERKQAEQALIQSLERERELGELKSRFVSMVSHEFRTPLATIQATTETIRNYFHKLDEDQLNTRFDKIQAQVKHMTMLLEDVLAFGWLQSGRREFNPAPVNIDQLCQEILEDLHSLDRIHQLIYTNPDTSLVADVDLRLMRQVISNLLTNAIKYSPEGTSVRFAVSHDSDTLVFEFVDAGIGIPAADQPHMFEAFYRATNVGHIAGTGLGLVVTKRAVELHGGSITFESTVGIGTRFLVSIPIDQMKR